MPSYCCAGGDGILQESSSDGIAQKCRGGVGTAARGEGVEKSYRGSPEEDRARSDGENMIVAFPIDAVSTTLPQAELERGRERLGIGREGDDRD